MPIKPLSDQNTGFIQQIPDIPEQEQQEIAFSDTWQAAFENENSFVSWAANGFSAGEKFTAVKDYDFTSDVNGYEPYADSFIESESPEQTAYIKSQIDRELQNNDYLQASGVSGVAAQMAAGLTDPLLLPFMFSKAFTGAKSVGEAFAVAAGTGAAMESVAEIAKHATQETRTMEESAFNIGGAALFSGVIGSGAQYLGKKQVQEMGKKMDEVLSDPSPRSAGAAEVKTISDDKLDIVGRGIVSKGNLSPQIRMATSSSRASKLIINQMTESSLLIKGAKDGETVIPEGGAVETRVKRWDANLAKGIEDLEASYMAYRGKANNELSKGARVVGDLLGGRGDKLTPAQFRIEVGKAMRRNDQHAIHEVAKAAQSFRRELFDPMKNAAIDEKLLPEGVDVSTAASYLMRMYNTQKIIAKRPEWDKTIEDWFKRIRQKNLDEIELYNAKGRKIPDSMRDQAYTPDMDIKAAVRNITDNILGNNAGRGSYDVKVTVKGPLKERVLNIPDSMIEDFLESDIDIIAKQYKMTMAPDIELTRQFGDIDMSAEVEAIKADYKKLIDSSKTEKQRSKLQDLQNRDVGDLKAVRDRLLGTYMMPNDPNHFMVRAGRNLRDINFVRMLGGMTLSAIPDMARPVAVNGLRPVSKALLTMSTSPARFKMARLEAKKMGIGLDMVLNGRAASLADIADIYQRGTKFEKGLKATTDAFGKLTLMSHWNSSLKQFTGVVTQDRILTESIKWADGKISKASIKRLASSGIDEGLAKRISEQFKQYGDDGDLLLSNGYKWDDVGAMDSLFSAVLKDVDRAILTPGVGEKPLWTSSEMGKTVFQFKSFAATAHHKILVSDLQYADKQALNGFLISVALGGLTYGAKQYTAGREIDTDPSKLLVESLDRSGAFGYLWDVNNSVEKLSRGTIGANALAGAPPMSRYASRNLVASFAGPSFGTAKDLLSVGGAVLSNEFTEKEVRTIRKLLPAQNLFYMRRLFDTLEEKITK